MKCVRHSATMAQRKSTSQMYLKNPGATVKISIKFCASSRIRPAGDFSKVKEATVVLNASGIGMGSHIGENPLPKEFISKDQFYFDACYGGKTQL